eukprot:15455134-Alexandrium_andersonii.AAC.1
MHIQTGGAPQVAHRAMAVRMCQLPHCPPNPLPSVSCVHPALSLSVHLALSLSLSHMAQAEREQRRQG